MYKITFYLCVCLVILVIINIAYVSYSFSRNRFGAVWPLRVLRSVVSFIVTVLFMPIFELFISMLECAEETGSDGTVHLVNHYAHGLICWYGEHYIHAFFAILVSVAFVIICIVVSITYYESKTSHNNHSARIHSRADVFLLISKIISILLFAFFNQEYLQWILIFAIFILSAFMYLNFHFYKPYYNQSVQNAHLICTGVFFWNCTVLLIGKILSSTSFNGCLELFFIGIPIIIAIILTRKDDKLSILLTNINKFQKGEQVQLQIRYFLEIVDQKDHNRNSKILLKGYIFLYEDFCTLPECALKKYISGLESNQDNVAYLFQHAQTLFQNGISKFPNSTSLRINYSFFLLERMNNKQQASLELTNAEKYNPKFDEQFIIYRYKKIIEESSSDLGEGEGNLDVVSNIAYQNHFTQFKSGIQRAANLYMDFWSLLINPNQDNQDDLTKLNEHGSKINVIVEEITNHFEKMQKLKHNDQEAIRLYAEFLNDILNDKEKSLNNKNRLNEIEGTKHNYEENIMNFDLNNLGNSDEHQYIFISTENEKFNIINKISLGVCATLGYSKSELLGKSLDIITPDIYTKAHKNILIDKINDYKKINTGPNQKTFKSEFKEIFAFAKNKSRYLVPLNFKVSLVPSPDQSGIMFAARIYNDSLNYNNNIASPQACYVITNTKFQINGITATCINLLGFTQNMISSPIDLTKMIKELLEDYIRSEIENTNDPDLEDRMNQDWNMFFYKYLLDNYKYPKVVSFRRMEDRREEIEETHQPSPTAKSRVSKIYSEENLRMTVSELKIRGRLEGFIFKFEHVVEPHTNVSSNEINSQDPNSSLKVDKNFIPDVSQEFHIDAKKMSYLKNSNNLDDMKKFIRDEANKKLRMSKKDDDKKKHTEKRSHNADKNDDSERIDESGNESYSNSGSDDEDDEEDDSSDPDISKESSHVSEDVSVKKKALNEYYTVNMSNIKLLVYDHKSGIIREYPKEDYKISQVQVKKEEDFNKKSESTDKQKVDEVNEKEKDVKDVQSNDISGSESILVKQIEYALSKQENQPTIVRMRWICFVIFLILLTLTCLFLGFFISAQNEIKMNFDLINSSYKLVYNTVIGAFHVKELTLLANSKYTNYLEDINTYYQKSIDVLKNNFNRSNAIYTSIVASPLNISYENSMRISNDKISILVLDRLNNTKTINLTVSSSFVEANTALFHICNREISNITTGNEEVFFYLYNSQNSIILSLFNQAFVFIDELIQRADTYKIQFIFFIGAVLITCIVSYFLVYYSYAAVGKRKESYLEVFFQIDYSVKKTCLDKCEKFSKKIQSEDISEGEVNLDEAEMIADDTQLNKTSKKNNVSFNDKTKKRKNNSSRENNVVKLKILFGQFLILSKFGLIYYFYYSYLTTVSYYVKVFNITSQEQSYYLFMHNLQREYFNDPINSRVWNYPSDYLFNKSLEEIYDFKEGLKNITRNYESYLPSDALKNYTGIRNDDICYFPKDFFKNYSIDCQEFMSNSTSYGLDIVLSSYFEEMRLSVLKFNNLLSKLKLPNASSNYSLMDIFNEKEMLNLNIQFRYIVQPAFESIIASITSNISNYINNFSTIYISIFSVSITLLFIVYIGLWRPVEYNLNQTIYKTKNMLSIIPKEVLATLSNIHKLLDIGQNFSKVRKQFSNSAKNGK